MSDADPEAITVSADGITVRKTVDTEQFQTLAVVIELATERQEISRVQLLDRIPDEVSMDDVGFHPEYGAEHWSVEDGAVAFERDLEPGNAYTTIYGIREFPEDDVDVLMREPEVALVDTGPDSLDEVIDEDRSQAVRKFLSGDADLPGLEVDDAAGAADEQPPASPAAGPEPVEEPEPAPEPEPVDSVEPEPEPAEATSPPDEVQPGTEPEPADAAELEEPAPTEAAAEPEPAPSPAESRPQARDEVRVPLTGGVVRVLIKELRDGDVDPEDRRLLRDELLNTEGSTETRVGHLQQRVSDLEAYSDALKAFIDEEGTADAIVSELRDDVGELRRGVRAVDDRLDEASDEIAAVDDRFEAVTGDVETVRSRVDLLTDRLEDVEDDIISVDQQVDDLAARIDGVSADIDGVDGRVDGIDDNLNALAGQVDELRSESRSERGALRDDIDGLTADLEDFEVFRDRLSSVFGGSGPAGSLDPESDDN